MKMRRLAVLMVPFLLGGCFQSNASSSTQEIPSSSSRSEEEPATPIDKDIEVSMVSHYNGEFAETEFTDTCHYSDSWFFQDSYTMNPKLALVSAMSGGASYSNRLDNNGRKIASLLEAAGFSSIQKNEYYSQGIKLEDSMGAIIGKKILKDDSGKRYTLLGVFPRNAGYGAEWTGNFNIGEKGFHTGFLAARDEMLRFMKYYISANNVSGDLKIWAAGFSRGAAVINLLGGFLAEDSGYFGNDVRIAPKDLFVYTIGTPSAAPTTLSKGEALSVSGARGEGYSDTNIPVYTYSGSQGNIDFSAERYHGIHNFVAYGDYVTKLPPESWGFTRFGMTEKISYGEPDMLSYLAEYAPDIAEKFDGGKTYSSQLPLKTLDYDDFAILDSGKTISADAMLNERFAALFDLAQSRAKLGELGYGKALAALLSAIGTDMKGFLDGLTSETGTLVKAVIANVFAHIKESLNLEDAEAVASGIMDLMDLAGKTVQDRAKYTDQDFLKDLLDFLINDYQTNEKAVARAQKIKDLIPAPYGDLYLNLVKYAKEKEMAPTTVDGLVLLLSSYLTANRQDPGCDALVGALAKVFPAQYSSLLDGITQKEYNPEDYPDEISMTKAKLFDLFECFEKGVYQDGELAASGDQVRYGVLSLGSMFVLSSSKKLANLVVNGAIDSEGNPLVSEPASLALLMEDVLGLILPKDEDGKRLPLVEGANKLLGIVLEKGKTEINAPFISILSENAGALRKALFTLLFKPGEEFSLKQEVDNAVNFVQTMIFVYPAHTHELYISYLKALANPKAH